MNENKKNPVQRFERMKEVIEQRLDSVVLIVEATYMRHNLSAMFRTAESFGLQNVYFVCSKNIYKSSASRGSERWLSVEIVDSIDDLYTKLKKEGYSFFIADFEEESFVPNTVQAAKSPADPLLEKSSIPGHDHVPVDFCDPRHLHSPIV